MLSNVKFWRFIAPRLLHDKNVTLLVVAESRGSSPGRAGYKMAVTQDGELCGSIGGGVMEVALVERAKAMLARPEGNSDMPKPPVLVEQVHQKNAVNSSGMICSGRQTIIFKQLTSADIGTVNSIVDGFAGRDTAFLEISNLSFQIVGSIDGHPHRSFTRTGESDFVYRESLGPASELFIIGGGHCSLALSELAKRLGFRISIFDDRPELNTLEKNEFADAITVISSYEEIADRVPSGDDVYVIVMTLGYRSDAIVIRRLIDHRLKYFGVLGSKAKIATLMKELRDEGFDAEKLARIHTPIGIPINSHTPEEIAVSIAAELISVRNS